MTAAGSSAGSQPSQGRGARRRDLHARPTRQRRGPIARSREIWASRKTLWLLVKRDLKVRYAGSVLGYVWTFLDPLLMSLVYWFVFTVIFQRSVGQDPYIIFLLTALLPWTWFNQGVQSGLKSLSSQSRLVRATSLPREVWVLRVVIAKGIEFAFSLPVLAVFMIFYPTGINGHLWLFPVAIVMQFVLLSGTGLLLSPLMILLKDVEPLVSPILRLLFYASPVIYGVSDVAGQGLPGPFETIFLLNPMAGIISAFRGGFFAVEFNGTAIGTSAILCVLIFAFGWWVFSRLERTILKEM